MRHSAFFILNYPLKDEYLTKIALKIEDDVSNVGMGEKIKIFVSIFPNGGTPRFNNLKGDMIRMKDIRNTVAHNSRFFFGGSDCFPPLVGVKRYSKGNEPVEVLYKEYNGIFKRISELLEAIYNDWDYKESFLYGINTEQLSE